MPPFGNIFNMPTYCEANLVRNHQIEFNAGSHDETIRMVGNLVTGPDCSIDEVDPATIVIGEPVEVVFARIEDVALPRWRRPRETEGS